MLYISTAVFVATLLFVGAAVIRGRQAARSAQSSAPSQRSLSVAVSAAVALTTVILFVLLVASVRAGRAVASTNPQSAVTIAVVGHQWWWEIEYEDAIPSRRVRTANEIHIPTHRPIVFKVTSRDVIHSFWAPNLQGKRDLIPGYTTAIWTEADRPGVFRGQCAEFCGLQHAHMAFEIRAEPEADFQQWLDRMRQPAPEPQTADERRGRDVFMTARCAGCHTVTGTEARGQIAPDLTHIAARQTLGAGTLSNTDDHRRAWIRDPQSSKPGNQMPPNPLPDADLEALRAYLRTLQ
jgi:cytochrome c oxidase subunit 2